jgi:hypothetical protein
LLAIATPFSNQGDREIVACLQVSNAMLKGFDFALQVGNSFPYGRGLIG